MKRCSSCKQTKSFEWFTKNKSRPDGHHVQCRDCRKAYYYKYDIGKEMWKRPGVKEKMTKTHQKWVERNREKYNAYMREWNKSNKDYTDPKIIAYGAKR